MIITQLLASCAIETYGTNPASQEMPWQGTKYKTPPTSSVGQLRLCHYSGFPPPSSIPSHVLPSIPHNTTFPTLCVSFRRLLPLCGSRLSRQGAQRTREPLSSCGVLMLRMRAGCRSQRQGRRKATFSLGDHEMGLLHTQSSSQDTRNLCVLRASGSSGEPRCQTLNAATVHMCKSCFRDQRLNLNSHSV